MTTQKTADIVPDGGGGGGLAFPNKVGQRFAKGIHDPFESLS